MGFMDDDEKLSEKFSKLKQEANLKAFLDKDEINEKGKEKRKLEAKKDKTEEDEKKIRQIQQETQRLAMRQQQAQQIVNRASLGEKILKCYFAYKMASLLCRTFLGYDRDHYNNGGGLTAKIEDELQERLHHGEIDIPTARAEQIEQVRDQFDKINVEAKELGISQNDIFTQQDKENLTDLATISRDTNNPQQAELYASKCEDLGLDRNEALQAFQQDVNNGTVQHQLENNEKHKEHGHSHEMEV
jgi:hypothetical protein